LAQLNNFGIGLEGTGTNNNVVEENTVFGNSNGLFMTAGVQGNIIRGNIFLGNPPVQVSVDNPSSSGVDIKNLADPGANAFEGNACVTSINAPCSSLGPSLTASPNPIPVTGNTILGSTTISWNAPDAQVIEVHIGSPNGPLFTQMGNRGSIQTGTWVSDGLTFYLQDVTGGNPLTADYTLATLVVHLQKSGTAYLHFPGGPRWWPVGATGVLLGLSLCCVRLGQFGPSRKRLWAVLRGAALLAGIVFGFSQTAVAQSQPSPQQTAATLDRMIAAHKSQQELAQYLFDTHGCEKCHTMGSKGKLGFTEMGKQRAKGFEGCISMLTAMTVIVQVREDRRSAQQRQKAERFEEFGCTTCHKITPGKLDLTEVGAKLTHLHLGCVDVEKLVSSQPVRNN
jgi:parallel beta-helix repeat protein